MEVELLILHTISIIDLHKAVKVCIDNTDSLLKIENLAMYVTAEKYV